MGVDQLEQSRPVHHAVQPRAGQFRRQPRGGFRRSSSLRLAQCDTFTVTRSAV
jgi:hypothetical protein